MRAAGKTMYLDSCIIVKLLVSHEPDSEVRITNVVAGHPVVTSELAVAEVRSALLAKERTGQDFDRSARQTGWRLFQKKCATQEFVLLPLEPPRHRTRGRGDRPVSSRRARCGRWTPFTWRPRNFAAANEMCSSDARVRARPSDFIGLAARAARRKQIN